MTINNVAEDLTYVTHRRSVEKKKIEKLKAQLHLLNEQDEPQNSHIIFVDNEKEAKELTPAKALDTHPSLINRSFNRLKNSQLVEYAENLSKNEDFLKDISRERRKSYKTLAALIKRENKLRILQEKLEVRKKLMVWIFY